MKKFFVYSKYFLAEGIIVFVFVLLIQNFTGYTLTGDGIGYYDYLPSLFIHKDLIRKNYSEEQQRVFDDRTEDFGMYVDYHDGKVNKCPCGTAVLESPFFISALIFTEMDGTQDDGYQDSFSIAVLIAAVSYLFLTLILLKKLLLLYNIGRYTIVFSQIFLVFSTSLTQYAGSNAAFSHVYSLFAITAFVYFAKKYFEHQRPEIFILICIFFGFVVILRNINLLIILFIPFLAGSFEKLKQGILLISKKPLVLTTGLLLSIFIVFIQMLLWYLQTGSFVLYSYQGEGFNFLEPQFINILFSYRKGLFIYTPVLLFGLVGVFWLAVKKKYYLFLTWMTFFISLTYILSSWWSWYFGRSYGLRAYIDFYAIFFVPFAILLEHLRRPYKIVFLGIAFLTIPLNIIQNYQYKSYIIHGTKMDKEKYWKVFLKIHDSYRGIFYKKTIDEKKYKEIFVSSENKIVVQPDKEVVVWKEESTTIKEFASVKIIQILFENKFLEKNHSRVLLSIKDENDNVTYYHRPYFIQFTNTDFNRYQTGIYNFELSGIKNVEPQTISISVISDNSGTEMKNFTVRFLVDK